ncbi:phage baseplate assembly protein [Paraburkholderia antibiotica]|uniref:Baseplate hub protein gp44-like N-terminal domain-containing protein n=1 Tax=Paraburkholderia antibiotica TaxID=2728839 RepID=A0A7Y0A0E7_9BURK|nr:hypothetical protein [Paraburkholderia antibiotica]NML34198.1 hypothetical protein [Paraburkholderia antibiotica]
MIDDIARIIDRTTIEGWKSLRITRDMECIPAEFDISMTERYSTTTTVMVMEGDSCVVNIGADPVITGYVDHGWNPSATGHAASVDVSQCLYIFPPKGRCASCRNRYSPTSDR